MSTKVTPVQVVSSTAFNLNEPHFGALSSTPCIFNLKEPHLGALFTHLASSTRMSLTFELISSFHTANFSVNQTSVP